MKSNSLFLLSHSMLSLALLTGLPALHGQDMTKPVIPVPPSPAQTPAPVLVPTPLPAQTALQGSGQAPTAGQFVAGQPKSAAGVTANYVIGPKDGLSVAVWKEPTVSATVEVRTDGMITVPLLGDIKAVDFTPTQLADDITTRLRKFITDPIVTVTVLTVNSKHIFFTGEGIGHPGEMLYDPNITTLQAIISAGGIAPTSSGKHIYILRNVSGKVVRIAFDYKKAVKTGDQQGVTLLPGDTVVVK